MAVLLLLSILSPVAAIVIGARRSFKSLVWVYAVCCLIFDLTLSGVKHLTGFNYKIVGNAFFSVELSLVTGIFISVIGLRRLPLLVVLGLWMSAYLVRSNIFTRPDFFLIGMLYLFYMVYSLCGFYMLMSESRIVFIEKSRRFWVLVTFLLYGAGDCLILLFRDYIVSEDIDHYNRLWGYGFLTINIVKNAFLAIALWCNDKNTSELEGSVLRLTEDV